MPPPERITRFCLPVTSQAKPKRGPHCKPRSCMRYLPFAQVAAWQIPWNGVPVPGISRPTSKDGRKVLVTGSKADLPLVVPGVIAGWYRRGAFDALNALGTNVDACSEEWYCGGYQAARTP